MRQVERGWRSAVDANARLLLFLRDEGIEAPDANRLLRKYPLEHHEDLQDGRR